GGIELAELAPDGVGREQSGLELVEHLLQRVDEAGTLGGARKAPELCSAHDTPNHECLLNAPEPRTPIGQAASEIPEHVLERPDRAAQQRRSPGQQLQL